jgi:hypothetical protein
MEPLDMNRPGAWKALFPEALRLMDHLESATQDPPWTFGGGTVLMLRLNHRESKDIDLFVPDPQYLWYVNPRLSDAAADVSPDYEEGAVFVKLLLPAGEIDVVAGQSLTEPPYELVHYNGRTIRVETSAEIIAKKLWHRGDRAKARDLFDLCAVARAEPEAIEIARPFFAKHGAAFIQGLESDVQSAREAFDAIVKLPGATAIRGLHVACSRGPRTRMP